MLKTSGQTIKYSCIIVYNYHFNVDCDWRLWQDLGLLNTA